ncbi:hypothetical protein [Leucobacter luti]|uniref:hypothetical protein n=1 Tax=Leucobacter luti TaxID=340320 RepID=UPI003CFDC40F
MFGFGKKVDDLVGQLRPELSREPLGVGPAFPGIAPNPLLSKAARQRGAELREGALAIGTLVDWREISSDGSPRVALIFDVETAEGVAFRGIADESISITELTRLALGQRIAVRYRPTIIDHYVALATDVDPTQVQDLIDRIQRRSEG